MNQNETERTKGKKKGRTKKATKRTKPKGKRRARGKAIAAALPAGARVHDQGRASPDRILSCLACYQRNFVQLTDLSDVAGKYDVIIVSLEVDLAAP